MTSTDELIAALRDAAEHDYTAIHDLLLTAADRLASLSAERDQNKRLVEALGEAHRLLRRYRDETPMGYQPHMIAHEVDATLAQPEEQR